MDIHDANGRLIGTTCPHTAQGYQLGSAAKHTFMISPRAGWAAITILWSHFALQSFIAGKPDVTDFIGATNFLFAILGGMLINPRLLGVLFAIIGIVALGLMALIPSHPFIITAIAWAIMVMFDGAASESEAEATSKGTSGEAKPKIAVELAYAKRFTEEHAILDFELTCTNNCEKGITMAKGRLVINDPLGDVLYEGTFTLPKPLAPGECEFIAGEGVYDLHSTKGNIIKHIEKIKYITTIEKILFEDGTTFQA